MDAALNVGDTGYLVQMISRDGAIESVEVHDATVEEVGADSYRVRHRAGVTMHKHEHLYARRDDAEQRRFAVIGWLKARSEAQRNGGKLAPLPEPLGALDGVIMSSNPLRIGEPNVAFSAQSNAWGKQDSAQKVLQRLAAVFEDIAHLDSLLSLIPHGTEYAKRLVAKYVILELHAAFDVLKRLASLDNDYKMHDHPKLVAALAELDVQYRFRMVRNKISAHRDGDLDVAEVSDLWARITRRAVWSYFDAFEKHLQVLAARYPREISLYFRANGKRVPLFTAPSPDYLSFDPPAEGLPPYDELTQPFKTP